LHSTRTASPPINQMKNMPSVLIVEDEAPIAEL